MAWLVLGTPLVQNAAIVLRTRYAQSGTDRVPCSYQGGPAPVHFTTPLLVRVLARYAMPGTDIPYGATRRIGPRLVGPCPVSIPSLRNHLFLVQFVPQNVFVVVVWFTVGCQAALYGVRY